MKRIFLFFFGVLLLPQCVWADDDAVRKLHLVQDDAQDYMVSKIYRLKYVQANDVTPFAAGMVMRYNINSTVNSITGSNNEQLLTVTCPVEMMPYVDDFIAKIDRDVKIDGKTPGEIIRGTGITRATYQPKYRSGQALANVLINSVIGEGPAGAIYAWDKNSNQIYWKDNASNTQYVYQFLGFLDRPAPQISFEFKLYEVRESRLRDLGIEYLAWKNGPGLNLFQTAFDSFSLSSGGSAALSAMSGPVGGFFFAPQFDASFIRLLGQSGNAEITDTAHLTVANSDEEFYEIYFDPQFQNIVKNDNDRTSVTGAILNLPAGFHQLYLRINQPIANIHYGKTQPGYPATEAFTVHDYQPGFYNRFSGTVYFGYELQSASVVERNNLGSELVETSRLASRALIPMDREFLLAKWEKKQEVEETIGIPWLCRIPYLGLLFGTTTTSEEVIHVSLTVTARILNTAPVADKAAGEVIEVK